MQGRVRERMNKDVEGRGGGGGGGGGVVFFCCSTFLLRSWPL